MSSKLYIIANIWIMLKINLFLIKKPVIRKITINKFEDLVSICKIVKITQNNKNHNKIKKCD